MVSTEAATAVVNAIQEGSFPESETVLSSGVDSTTIPPLLHALKLARDDLSDSVRVVSRQEAGDVDGWIAQARRVQADIARCKEDARQIVRDHKRIEELQRIQDEARSETHLLETEISYNETLEKRIESISKISADLARVDTHIRARMLVEAAQNLPDIMEDITTIPSDQTRTMLHRLHSELDHRLGDLLQKELDKCFHVAMTDVQIQIHILQKPSKQIIASRVEPAADGQETTLSLDHILECVGKLQSLEHVYTQLSDRVNAAVIPHLHKRSRFKISNAETRDEIISLDLSAERPSSTSTISAILELVKHLHEQCPAMIRQNIVKNFLEQALPLLIVDWLDLALPLDLDRIKDIDDLLTQVTNFDEWLRDNGYSEASQLNVWINQMPRTWISQRLSHALDSVRMAFKMATGELRQVERIESQTVNVDEDTKSEAADDDWAENWDDDDQSGSNDGKQTEETSDDASDAWGFDADDQSRDESAQPAPAKSPVKNQDDEADAWGWGDEDDAKPEPTVSNLISSNQANGEQASKVGRKDIVLKENYAVTDIPEYIIEQIGKDLSDHQQLSSSPSTYFRHSSVPSSGLSSLPTLTLAMFRAMAHSSYQSDFSPPLSNLNIYNDTLYLATRLSPGPNDAFSSNDSSNIPAKDPLYTTLTPEIPILEKFARQVYTSELSTHRTILLDLLDTAQGFVSCTRPPYAETCEIAITATTEHIRTLHKTWRDILSPSHLGQSVGSLLNSVMRKMIEDIEDMEDISEPESRKLLALCEKLSTLEDLFVADPGKDSTSERPGTDADAGGPVSTVAIHCASYLRFQYLQQILESNLVEIRYLWTDAGLSLEFRADEVVDMIKALFAESPQRRSAINAIKSSR